MHRLRPFRLLLTATTVLLGVVLLSISPPAHAQNTTDASDDVLWVRQDPLGSEPSAKGPRLSDENADVIAARLARQVIRSSAPDTTERDRVYTDGEQQTLTLRDAVRIALKENYDLRDAELDVQDARAQVKEARGSVFPRVDVNGSYTRNVVQANPFAGSDVSSIFGGGAQSDWVAFNERRRTDGDPSTEPITIDEFRERQQEAREAAGVNFADSSNPFGVDNEFLGSVQLTQTLYDKSAFSALRGAQQFQDVSRRGLDRRVQTVANDVYEAFYAALLAKEQVRVLRQRTERTEETLQEVSARVRRGVAPKLQRMSTEVELSNLRTELIQAENDAGLALDQLKVTLGLSVDADIQLNGELETDSQDLFINTSTQAAISQAVEQRADLKRAQLAIELREIQQETIEAEYYPQLEAVATFSYSGRVPDNREQILTDPNDPFFYDTLERDFFDDSYWNPTLTAGLRMSWNVFNGFQTSARMEQQDVAIHRAQLQHDQLRQSIELEVSSALRRLQTARRRIQSQRQTVDNAETNYRHTERRLAEGVSSPLELRDASDQLDRSRLNYLQAVYDYLVARSDFETAVGMPLTPATDNYQMTAR
ncbi:transporter [Longibacter salinarum]|uniref:Transporter n=1 Tax=Longibacter salinarum TaxID=1850348 RepID=A0A2A8CTE3_9BACT|nr:TolC family protein [Longibacter salinarum]PEN10388.1 transporter [Longibacter salinarum]